MKVIFLEDVPGVARAGDAKNVADGYGRNYLLPKRLAVLANSASSNIVEAQMKAISRREAQTEAEMKELAKQLEGREVTLKARTGAKDRLYGSITSADIATALNEGAAFVIDKRKVEIGEPIRNLGSHEVDVRLARNVVARIKVTVVEDAEQKAEKEARPEEETRAEKEAKPKKEVKPKKEAKPEKEARPKKETRAEKEARPEKKAKTKKEAKPETVKAEE